MLHDIITQTPKYKITSTGVLLFYDSTRDKFLSSTRQNFYFAYNHLSIVNDLWLQTVTTIPTNVSGYNIPRNGTIVSLSIQTQNLANCVLYIRRNNIEINLAQISLTGESSNTVDNLNVNLTINDWIQCYLVVLSGQVDYPVLTLEIAWRE